MNNTILLTSEEVRRALHYPELIRLLKDAFAGLSAGTVKMLPRNAIFHDNGNLLAQMPAYIPGLGISGTKIAMFPGPGKADTCQSAILLFDSDSGALKAIVAAGPITVIRTAASSAAATDVLARPDAAVLCLMGAGTQAVGHAQAICAIRPIKVIRVWSNDPQSSHSGAEQIAALCPDVSVSVCEDARQAVTGADIICTVTKAKEPILYGPWIKPGAHINAVGAVSPGARELDISVLTRSKIYADQKDACLSTAGDLVIPIREGLLDKDPLTGEIGGVINGSCPGRAPGDNDTITVFESIGLGFQDVAAAYSALKNSAPVHSIDF